MERLTDAISIDDIEEVKEILKYVDSSAVLHSRVSDCESAVVFTSEEIQDAFTQAAFCGSLKSLQALRQYGKQ